MVFVLVVISDVVTFIASSTTTVTTALILHASHQGDDLQKWLFDIFQSAYSG